jgi:hypothetical protein
MPFHQPERAAGSRTRIGRTVRRRPAESAGVAGSVLVGLFTAIHGHDWVTAAAAIVGVLPACWTFVLDQGGVVGIWRELMNGRNARPAGRRRAAASAPASFDDPRNAGARDKLLAATE